MKTFFLGVALLLLVTAASAEETLLQGLPNNVSEAQIIASTKAALIKRQWTIKQSTPSTVIAQLEHAGYNAELTIMLKDRILTYTENTTAEKVAGGRGGGTTFIGQAATPERWIAGLRQDINKALATIAASGIAVGANHKSVVERMEALSELRKKGLISEQEYENKRKELLEEL